MNELDLKHFVKLFRSNKISFETFYSKAKSKSKREPF